MLTIDCSGTPYEIGYTHGSEAKLQIARCISFYEGLFIRKSSQTWPQVLVTAAEFSEQIKSQWPQYYEEIQGIADGAGKNILDIIALNVRTEIAFGQFSDGCTSVSFHAENQSWLGQNWDWMVEQKENLIILRISADTERKKPGIAMVTEAGIIGKIGFNDRGVGTCLNAIRAKGCEVTKLPVHLGLRMALESHSAEEAVKKLEASGMASSAYILVADGEEGIGLEFTTKTSARLTKDMKGTIIHSNHLLAQHAGVYEPGWLKDSPMRIAKMEQLTTDLVEKSKEPSLQDFSRLFEDESNLPSAICRKDDGKGGSETLFNIVVDLQNRSGTVRMGRPVGPDETVKLECM